MNKPAPERFSSPTPAQALEDVLIASILSTKANDQHRTGAIGKDELSPYTSPLKDLSSRYVAQSGAARVSELHAAAYALYFLPINFAKLCFLLRRSLLTPDQAPSKPLTILDFGCGPGTGALAALATLAYPLDITVLDKEDAMRDLALKLVSAYGAKLSQPEANRLAALKATSTLDTNSSYDLIIAANVFNELEPGAADSTVRALAKNLTETGTLLLLEPALPAPTRALMKMRNSLLASFPMLSPVFPCTHRAPCPMLKATKEDWCHGTLEGAGKDFEDFKLVTQLDELLGFNKHRVKYSASILKKGSTTPKGYRVITDAEKTHRGTEIALCGEDFFGTALLTKGAMSDDNRHLRRVRSYELVTISPKASATLPKGAVVGRIEEA
jgi:ribosomal protein RSM22 (predicted rRNA methylase)